MGDIVDVRFDGASLYKTVTVERIERVPSAVLGVEIEFLRINGRDVPHHGGSVTRPLRDGLTEAELERIAQDYDQETADFWRREVTGVPVRA